MNAVATLADLAARQADRELVCLPGKRATQTTITELAYAGQLFVRAEKAISEELAVLRAAGVEFDLVAVLRTTDSLLKLGYMLSLLALQAQEERAA